MNSKIRDKVRMNISNSQPITPTKTLSLVPLLLTGESISREARQALRENRLKDAALILMSQYGLSCVEAEDLLNVPAC